MSTNYQLPMLLMPRGLSTDCQQHTTLKVSIRRPGKLKEAGFLFYCLNHLWSSCPKLWNTTLVTQMQPLPVPNPPLCSHNPSVRFSYLMDSLRHLINDCWLFEHKMQDLVDWGAISFKPPDSESSALAQFSWAICIVILLSICCLSAMFVLSSLVSLYLFLRSITLS